MNSAFLNLSSTNEITIFFQNSQQRNRVITKIKILVTEKTEVTYNFYYFIQKTLKETTTKKGKKKKTPPSNPHNPIDSVIGANRS